MEVELVWKHVNIQALNVALWLAIFKTKHNKLVMMITIVVVIVMMLVALSDINGDDIDIRGDNRLRQNSTLSLSRGFFINLLQASIHPRICFQHAHFKTICHLVQHLVFELLGLKV